MKIQILTVKINNMNLKKLRPLIAILALIAYFARFEPEIFIILSILTIFAFLIIITADTASQKTVADAERESRRRTALSLAKIYLAPYKSIWKNQKLSNKYCYLLLGKDGLSISAKEKVFPYRSFKIISSQVHNQEDLWDMFCINFSFNKSYDGLLEDCRLYKVVIQEDIITQNLKTNQNSNINHTESNIEKIDINNCSEMELTALPGISIVMSKKIIKKREEINGFKTIDEFFLFLKLKEHMQKQLRDKICITKMKGTIQQTTRNTERSIDL